MKHFKITVHGIVQGVFFRASTKQQADALGIKGWVSNQDDGSVYLEAEGGEAQLKALEDWLWQGPAAASVEQVIIEEADIQGYQSFEIRL